MYRRDFMKTAGTVTAIAAVPASVWSALSGMSEQEVEERVADTLAKMTLEEKVDLMAGKGRKVVWNTLTGRRRYTGHTAENERLGIPSLLCLDGPRGVGLFYKSTCFPVSMCRGATWNPELERKAGDVMGYETRSLGANMLLSPCINLLWHPRWGRAQETYGEDSHHLSIMGAAHVEGLQKHVMACVKHYAANNIEDTRFEVDAIIDERLLREVFLPHFRKTVEVGAASFMSAYNDINGELAAHNGHLIRDILKGDWAWDGFILSDWSNAVEDTVEAAQAGLDMEMPKGDHFGEDLIEAVRSGKVSESAVDEAASRIMRQLFRFVGPDYTKGYDDAKLGGKEHAMVALEVAREGMVLLKNDNKALPIDRGKVSRVAVMGNLAKQKNIGDLGSSVVTPPYVVTALQGMKELAGNVEIDYCSGKLKSLAERKAEKADVVVVIAGMTWKDEGEGNDRNKMGLDDDEIKLIKTVAKKAKKTVVVLIGGSAITMEGWHDDVDAIVMAWYPGMEGGTALAEVLYGDINPSGRLPIVFPVSEDQLYPFENKKMDVKLEGQHGQRWFDEKGIEPLYCFGHGLSYTSFSYSGMGLKNKKVDRGDTVTVRVDVKNTGGRDGKEVVQVYAGMPDSAVVRPVRVLVAFKKEELAAGEKNTVEIEFDAAELAYYDVNEKEWKVESGEYIIYAGPSAKEADLSSTKLMIV